MKMARSTGILWEWWCAGLSLYLNQVLSGQGSTGGNPQETVNHPIIFSGMFLFFPLPAGVLMYMLIANIFQTFVVSRTSAGKSAKNRGAAERKEEQ